MICTLFLDKQATKHKAKCNSTGNRHYTWNEEWVVKYIATNSR